jgi:hydroxymethylpyrimidine/phosphomethylpyrimidine kinase
MGAYMPDRFFWARSSDDETPPASGKDAAPGEARH